MMILRVGESSSSNITRGCIFNCRGINSGFLAHLSVSSISREMHPCASGGHAVNQTTEMHQAHASLTLVYVARCNPAEVGGDQQWRRDLRSLCYRRHFTLIRMRLAPSSYPSPPRAPARSFLSLSSIASFPPKSRTLISLYSFSAIPG